MRDINNIYQKFFQAIIKGGIKPIVEAAYEYFERPITVVDVTYKLICQLPDELVSDVVFDGIIRSKEIPQNIVLLLEEGKYRPYLDKNPQPTYVDWGNLEYPRIMGAIKTGQAITGYYAILYKDHGFQDEDLAAAGIFSQALGTEMRKGNNYQLKRDELSGFLMRELLDGSFKNSESISVWSKYGPSITKGGYLILYARKPEESTGTGLEYLSRTVMEKYPDCFSMVKDEGLYVFFYNLTKSKKEAELNKKAIIDVTEYLASFNIKCGLSRVFYDIAKLAEYKFMAEDALRVGRQIADQKNIFDFNDYIFYCLIGKIKQIPLSTIYVHPALENLLIYDQKYKTNFTDTLKCFIQSFKDLTATAEKLGIHRNSLKYRLKKITEISNVNLSDEILCAQLLWNFYTAELSVKNVPEGND